MRKPYVPALVLLILAPALPELLSGNMPPVKFFNPFALATLIVLYGGGAASSTFLMTFPSSTNSTAV
jgi:hypothetical protein